MKLKLPARPARRIALALALTLAALVGTCAVAQDDEPPPPARESEGPPLTPRQKEILRGREYWGWCLWAAVALLFLETALAQLFARRSR